MILEIIGVLIILIGTFNIIKAMKLDKDDNADCCCGTIVLIIAFSFYGFLPNVLRFLVVVIFLIIIIILNYDSISKLFDSTNDSTTNKEKTSYPEKKYKIPKIKRNPNPIDLNTASYQELHDINGISKASAERIINVRRRRSRIKSFDELNTIYHISNDEIKILKQNTFISNEKSEEKTKNTEKKYKKPNENNYKKLNKVKNDFLKKDKKKPNQKDSIVEKEKHNPDHYVGKRLDINKATLNELKSVPNLTVVEANKIIQLRKKGENIKSYDDLKQKLYITTNNLNKLREYIYIKEEKSVQKPKPYNIKYKQPPKKEEVKPKIEKKQEIKKVKIDINTASQDELAKLSAINLIKAKKIIQLRESNRYIKSFDDLKRSIDLKDYQVEQLKEEAYIDEKTIPRPKGRIINL
ncbi:MAG: helix-hairpin-helix domain-containing protein [Methanosphaera sp.]|nr:helix-hairpin-helix domain-containing protein [Methanosphaera sp.]